MAKISLLLAACLLAMHLVWGISINEIMYNPAGDDNNQEFLEIIGTDNLSGYTIGDLESNDSLIMMQFIPGNFSLIVEEGFNYSAINCSVYSSGATIGNNLNNEADTIFLYFEGAIMDSANYTSALANNNGRSLELMGEEWEESCSLGGSPGMENCVQGLTNQSANQSLENQTVDNSTNLENNTQEQNTSTDANHTTEVNNSCFVVLNLSTDKELYTERESVQIKNSISNDDYAYIIEYWVEDLFGNEVKKKLNTSNTNTKSYTPGIAENDKAFMLRNRLAFVDCINTNDELENEKLIVVKKSSETSEDNESDEELSNESKIEIMQVYLPSSGSLSFGDDFKVKLSFYKGDTGKTLVTAYVKGDDGKKVSFSTDLYLEKKYSLYELSIKVLLKPDCKLKSDDYTLVVEGLGEIAEESISIEDNDDNDCKEETPTQETKSAAASSTKTATAKTTAAKQAIAKQSSTNKSSRQDKIISFYTRTKNFNPKIMLYANIQANSSHTVILASDGKEQAVEINSSAKLEFNATAKPGSNQFMLELRKKGQLVDSKNLTVELKAEEQKKGLSNLTLGKADANNSLASQPGYDAKKSNEEADYGEPIAGNVVYESANMKIAKKAPFLLIPIAVLVIVGLLLSRKK